MIQNSPASAHDLPEQRRLILSISPTAIEMLVIYEMPGGLDARRYRAMMDLNGDGAIDREGYEALAQIEALLPRLSAGLEVSVLGQPVPLELEDVSFHDGAGIGADAGFLGMAIYAFAWQAPPDETLPLRLALSPGALATVAEVQGVEGVVLTRSVPSESESALTAYGPVQLSEGAAVDLAVRVTVTP